MLSMTRPAPLHLLSALVVALAPFAPAVAWAQIAPAGRSYSDPHLFVFRVGPDLLIDAVTAYWDNGSMTCQLGHVEVD